MEQKILPTRVLIKPLEEKEKVTQSGIFIPSTVKNPNTTGDVVLIGEKVLEMISPVVLNAGERVVYPPHAFQRVLIKDEEFHLVDCNNIILIYSPEK